MAKCYLCGRVERKEVAATKLEDVEYLEIPCESYTELANVKEGHFTRTDSKGKTYHSKTVKLCQSCR